MKCCDTNEEKDAREEGQNKLTGLAWFGSIGAALTCLACFTPLAVTLLGVIGIARWAGYLDYILLPLLALFAALLLIGLVRRRSDGAKLKGEN